MDSLSDPSQLQELSAHLKVAQDIKPEKQHQSPQKARLVEGDKFYRKPPNNVREVAERVLALLYDIYGT